MQNAIPHPCPGGTEPDPGTIPRNSDSFDPAGSQCSAAHAEWLRRLRGRKLYKGHASNWGEFCREHVGLSGPQASEIILNLEEFGPGYFDLAALAPITPDEFRTVASKVRGRFLCLDGEAIPLRPENVERITTALEKLRRPATVRSRKGRGPLAFDRVSLLDDRCREVTAEFRKLSKPKATDVDRLRLASVLRKTLTMLGRIEMELGIY